MEASQSMASSSRKGIDAFGSEETHRFLTSKLQVGSAKSDKISYSLAQKVFHSGDVPREVVESKRAVQKTKQANILGTEAHAWNQSTIADPRVQKDVTKDLKRQLLKVRAGLMDEYVIKPSKAHSDEKIAEQFKYIVSTTGQGPIGKLSAKWFNPVDERGLARHCIEPKWPDWNDSTSNHTKEDQKHARVVFDKTETKRIKTRARDRDVRTDPSTYISSQQSITHLNHALRERKVDFQDLKEQFKRELLVEFPNASEERLQAMAQRLLNEKLLADEKCARFPVQHESFRPNLSVTTQDRRYKEWSHPGSWTYNEAEECHVWSCCLNFGECSRGCESKIVNPDAWCTLGYERRIGVAAAGRK